MKKRDINNVETSQNTSDKFEFYTTNIVTKIVTKIAPEYQLQKRVLVSTECLWSVIRSEKFATKDYIEHKHLVLLTEFLNVIQEKKMKDLQKVSISYELISDQSTKS